MATTTLIACNLWGQPRVVPILESIPRSWSQFELLRRSMTALTLTPSEAVVLCTRNRPAELARTLRSVAAQAGADRRWVLVVDGSDPDDAARTACMVGEWRGKGLPFHYHPFPGSPAGTRQRNAGIDLLPRSVEIVHFIDDDVTLQPGYFDHLAEALRCHSRLAGVGGLVTTPDDSSLRPPVRYVHRLFLLRTDQPSRVLPSGQTTPAWPTREGDIQPAEWLSTCASSYRRRVFRRHRFDPKAAGPSPRLEDLDFSFRVAQDAPLAVTPDARCVHHVSERNRRNTPATTQERLVRRYWFVEKNLNHPSNRLAFWWSVVGQFVALVLSSNPDSGAALQGLRRGIRQVWTRDHPLLHPEPDA